MSATHGLRKLSGSRHLPHSVPSLRRCALQLPCAQRRLAASGAASTSTGGKPLALSDDVLQTTWVQPNVPPATTRNLPWGQGRVGTAFEPSQCGFPLFSRAGVATNRVRSEHSCPGVAENKSFDRRQSGSHRIADATTSSSPNNSTAAASTIVGETRPDQAYAIAASGASAPSRALYEPLTIANKSNNKNEQKVPRSLTVVPASTGTTLAPRVSFSARERTPQANADRAHSSTSGWRCIASSRGSGGSGGTTVGGEGRGDTENGESEVWEWNGRRVVLHRSPARPPLVEKGPEQEAKSSGGQERGERVAHQPSIAFDDSAMYRWCLASRVISPRLRSAGCLVSRDVLTPRTIIDNIVLALLCIVYTPKGVLGYPFVVHQLISCIRLISLPCHRPSCFALVSRASTTIDGQNSRNLVRRARSCNGRRCSIRIGSAGISPEGHPRDKGRGSGPCTRSGRRTSLNTPNSTRAGSRHDSPFSIRSRYRLPSAKATRKRQSSRSRSVALHTYTLPNSATCLRAH